MKKRFAIIGKGFIFSRHKQAIEANGGEVYLTCDIDVDKNPDFIDWVEMFNHPKFANVDYVSICAPNYLHSIIAREALFKGKKVLCEKPLSINGTKGMDGTMTVLQLRHHPKMQKIKKPKELFIEAKMFLCNLGIHYIDLAIFLLGNKWKILRVYKKKRKVVADIRFGKSLAHVHIEIVSNRKKQGRKLLMDGQEIILSNQDNLSYEDLHKQVYQDFLAGKGVTVKEAEKSLKLTSAILCF